MADDFTVTRRTVLIGGAGLAGTAAFNWIGGPARAATTIGTRTTNAAAISKALTPALVSPGTPSTDNIVFPADCDWSVSGRGVIDVTTFGADPTGVSDSTSAINNAIDQALQKLRDDIDNGIDHVESPTESEWIVYFPNGTYRITDTIVYSAPYIPDDPTKPASQQWERLQYLRLRGQSQEGVVLKLDDGLAAFSDDGNPLPVVSFSRTMFTDYTPSTAENNIIGTNAIENLTIDVGSDNPGAIGLVFAAANNNAIRNVTIQSSGSNPTGKYGLQLAVEVTQFLASNVIISGFNKGVTAQASQATQLTFSGLTLCYDHIGMYITGPSVSVENLYASGKGSAIVITDDADEPVWTTNMGVVSVINSTLSYSGQVDPPPPAVDVQSGCFYTRNQTIDGFTTAISSYGGEADNTNTTIDEYVTHDHVITIFDTTDTALMLDIEQTPIVAWPDVSEWVSVKDYGAVGDGWNDPRTHTESGTDDTAAIQSAMDSTATSGKSVVYFPPGEYLITSTITIPASVKRINFMYSQICAGNALIQDFNAGLAVEDEYAVFSVSEDSSDPLIIEDTFSRTCAGRYRFVSHDSTRTLIMSDLHTCNAAAYRNTVTGGQVFFENVSCRTDGTDADGNVADTGAPGFYFSGPQSAWARHINTEHADPEIENDAADLWILGFKTENLGTLLKTHPGSNTEIINGVVFNAGGVIPETTPLIDVSSNSSVSCTLATSADKHRPVANEWTRYVKQTHGSDVRYLDATAVSGATGETLMTDDDVRGPLPTGSQPNPQRRLMLFVGRRGS